MQFFGDGWHDIFLHFAFWTKFCHIMAILGQYFAYNSFKNICQIISLLPILGLMPTQKYNSV
jgi:hypothetical protein